MRKFLLARILLALLLVSSIFTFIISGIQAYNKFNEDFQEVNRTTEIVKQSFLNSITLSVWNLDNYQIDVLLSGISNLPSIAKVELKLYQKSEISKVLGKDIDENHRVIRKEYPLILENDLQKMELGKIIIYGDLEPVHENFEKRIWALILNNGVQFLLISIVLSGIFEKLIRKPIKNLALMAQSFKLSDKVPNISNKLRLREDEVGDLADKIFDLQQNTIDYGKQRDDASNELQNYQQNLELMVEEKAEKLKEASLQLTEASRKAGMASVAIELVHSLGNTLTSLRVHTETILPGISKELVNFKRLKILINDKSQSHKLDDPAFISTLAEFIDKNTESMAAKFSDSENRLKVLKELIEKAIFIIENQKQHTTYRAPKLQCDLKSIALDAIKEISWIMKKHDIEVTKDIEDISILSDNYKIFNIILIILTNSAESLEHVNRKKLINVRINAIDEDFVRIKIRDNGCGIDPQLKEQIFQHGFTNKGSHAGIGLHNAANWTNALGGQLKIDLLPEGTEVILIFPINMS